MKFSPHFRVKHSPTCQSNKSQPRRYSSHNNPPPFVTTYAKAIEQGVVQTFGSNDDRLIIRKAENGPQIIILHAFNTRVFHIHHYSRLGVHPGNMKLYHTIRRRMYWPAFPVAYYTTARLYQT